MGFLIKHAPAPVRALLLKRAIKVALLAMAAGRIAQAERILIKAVME